MSLVTRDRETSVARAANYPRSLQVVVLAASTVVNSLMAWQGLGDRAMYWSPAQMLAHTTINGTSARTGDVFASGTISGPEKEQRGAFIELTWGGAEPVVVGDEKRTFLEDGDEVVISASAPGPAGTRIGFGDARGRIVASTLA